MLNLFKSIKILPKNRGKCELCDSKLKKKDIKAKYKVVVNFMDEDGLPDSVKKNICTECAIRLQHVSELSDRISTEDS